MAEYNKILQSPPLEAFEVNGVHFLLEATEEIPERVILTMQEDSNCRECIIRTRRLGKYCGPQGSMFLSNAIGVTCESEQKLAQAAQELADFHQRCRSWKIVPVSSKDLFPAVQKGAKDGVKFNHPTIQVLERCFNDPREANDLSKRFKDDFLLRVERCCDSSMQVLAYLAIYGHSILGRSIHPLFI